VTASQNSWVGKVAKSSCGIPAFGIGNAR